MPSNPAWTLGYVPTPEEWNALWAGKADYPVPVNQGGTGEVTVSAAFQNLSPITTQGDLIVGGTGGAPQRLGAGSNGQVLTVVGGVPAYANPAAGTPTSLILATVAALNGATVASAVQQVTLLGYTAAGDSGAAVYNRSGTSGPGPGLQQSLDGAWWQIAFSDVYLVDQFGATGTPGVNDQPAIQAAYNYAALSGGNVVAYAQQAYELWCPIRTTNPATLANDGHPIVISRSVKTQGHPLKTTLTLKNSLGGPRTTITQVVAGVDWLGGCFYTKSASGNIEKTVFENMVVDGGFKYYATEGNTPNLYDKCIWDQNADVNNTYVYECEFFGFQAEICYINPLVYLEIDGLILHDSPQSCLNPSALCRISLNNVECYDAYGGGEYLGAGGQISNIYVHDCYVAGWSVTETLAGSPAYWYPQRFNGATFTATLNGTTTMVVTAVASGTILLNQAVTGTDIVNGTQVIEQVSGTPGGTGTYTLSYPASGSATGVTVTARGDTPPYLFFGDNCRFERIPQLLLHSWIRGVIQTVDSQVVYGGYNEQDSDFDIYSCVDRQSGLVALKLDGPANLTTPINAEYFPTLYYTPSKTTRIRLHGSQTAWAVANNLAQAAILVSSALFDASTVSVSVDGAFGEVFAFEGAPVSGFVLPRIDFGGTVEPVFPFGGTYTYTPTAGNSQTFQVAWAGLALMQGDVGVHTYAIGNDYGFSDGQEVYFYHNVGTPGEGILHVFPASGAGMSLPRAITLYQKGDYLLLRYDGPSATWRLAAYSTGYQTTYTGTASLAVPSLASGAWEHVGDITIAGVLVGDPVASVTCSVATGGVFLRGEVSATNTLSIYALDEIGSTWNPGTVPFTGVVQKQ